MAKQQPSETFELPLKSRRIREAHGLIGLRALARFDVETWVMIIVCAVTAYLVLPPLYSVVQTSLFTTKLTGEIDEFTFRYYRDLVREFQVVGPFLNTLYFSAGSALLATLLGGLVAWIVTRTDAPLRGLGYFTAFASFGTPFILYTIGWLLLLGKAGPVNFWLKRLLGQTEPVVNVYSMWGMIFVESLLWSPFVFLMLAAAFRSMDPSLEEASAACGARVWQTLRRISLRLMLPAFFSVMLLIFIRSFESFEIPALVGLPGDIRVLTTSIYLDAQKLPAQYGSAGAFSVLLMLVVAGTLYFYFRVIREGDRFQTVTGKGYRPALINLGKWRNPAAAGLLLYSFVLLVLPFFIILWASLLPFYIQPSFEAMSLFTLKNYITAIHYPKITDSIKNSMLLGLGSATLVMALTTLASWILVRSKLRGRWLLDLLTTLPLLFPGIVMGLAILRFYLLVPIPIYGTLWILLVAFVTRYIPYGIRYTHSGLLQLHRELEEAAYTSGASWSNCMRRIILPLLTPSFLGGWVFVFLLSAKELSMSILLVSPQTPVVSVAIYELWENGQVGELAAFSVIWSAILVSVAIAYYLIARRSGIQQQ
ncbi:MAG TPA: iron ABC transporter permease [Candidatus Acidoferrales bacterium]|jgi:iron(III) transport system permease protein|nr:iron ABC transporter permease [Candidatus Acidoferrales bacterium]